MDAALSITKTGTIITTGAASVSVAIPTDSAGGKPKYIRVSATQAAYVSANALVGTAAVAGDILVQPGDGAVILKVQSLSFVAAIQVAVAGVVQISPVENY